MRRHEQKPQMVWPLGTYPEGERVGLSPQPEVFHIVSWRVCYSALLEERRTCVVLGRAMTLKKTLSALKQHFSKCGLGTPGFPVVSEVE